MTFRNAVKMFTEFNEPFNDYWAMQQQWAFWIDCLCRQGSITIKQSNNWGNPCTPETFKRFNKKFEGGQRYRGSWFGSAE